MSRYSLYSTSDGKYTLVYNGNPRLVTRDHFSFKNLDVALSAPKAVLSSESYLTSRTHEADFDHLSDLPNTHPELYL